MKEHQTDLLSFQSSPSPFSMLPSSQKSVAIVTKTDSLHFDKLYHHLQSKYKVSIGSNDISSTNHVNDLFIICIAAGNEEVSADEIDTMNSLLQEGKSIALLVSSNNTTFSNQSVLNIFLSEYGITIESDGVIRTVYSKYLHPKHAYITDGVLHPNLIPDHLHPSHESDSNDTLNDFGTQVGFVYPHGCTLDVQAPSWSILSSGSLSFPLKRPICAVWEDLSKKKADITLTRGRLLVIGSTDIFSNEWLEKECNAHLLDKFIQFLLHEDESNPLSRSAMNSNAMIEDARTVPDIEALSERVKCCLQEHTPLPQDLNALYCRTPLLFDTSMIPKVMKLYNELNLKHEPLSLIKPEFERPHPSLEPAVFQPRMMDLAPPALDLFDLDEEFAEPKVRLAQLTNKCSSGHCDDDDLEYFVQEAGCISGLVGHEDGDLSGKEVLHKLFYKVGIFLLCLTLSCINCIDSLISVRNQFTDVGNEK